MNKKIIVVTGGAGFIGSHIVDEYINLGHKVFVIDNLSTGNIKNVNKKAHFLNLDIRDKSKLKIILKKINPSIINHHAAQVSVINSINNPINDIEINILGLANLLESTKNLNLKKFIFASSGGAIYGNSKKIPINEDNIAKPLSPYGISKEFSEKLIKFYSKKFGYKYLILRYSNVYGPRQNNFNNAGVISIFINNFMNNKKSFINGDGNNTRDYIYIDDIVTANKLALVFKKSNIFNIGTGTQTSTYQVYKLISKEFNLKNKILFRKPIDGEVEKNCLNNNKAKKYLNWEPTTKFKDGIRIMIDWLYING